MNRFLTVLVVFSAHLFGCTGILVQTDGQGFVHGRTVEFGIPLDMSVAVIPRGISFTGKTPLGDGKVYQSKYAAVGVYCFDDVVLMDGMNEKGLSAGAFYFPGYAGYAKITKANQSKAISPVEFPHWILTQFATIEEVKEAIGSILIAPTVSDGWGNQPPPMHYIVYDAKGNSIVIEPLDGKLKVYENKLGVITNSPTFDWHLTNLSNYINISPYNAEPQKLRDFALRSFGQGTGMLGLPGDFTPPSRFIRAAFFCCYALLSDDLDQAVDQAFHILNQFDIPLGVVAQKDGKIAEYDHTLLTCVRNPEALEYFYRTYENQSIEFVNFSQFDFDAKSIKTFEIGGKQEKRDISSSLRPIDF
jgi:choloylglycine hydrolase